MYIKLLTNEINSQINSNNIPKKTFTVLPKCLKTVQFDWKNSSLLMSCFDSRREKQAAAQALRVRTVIPKAKGHYWLFSGDKEKKKRPRVLVSLGA